MKDNLEIKKYNLVPIIGAIEFIDRYVSGVKNLREGELFSYARTGSIEILGLLLYNLAIISVSIKGLEKIIS